MTTSPTFTSVIDAFLGDASPCFRPYAQYCSVSRAVYVYLRDEPSFAERVDPTLTLLLSMDSGSITGLVVDGVQSDPAHNHER